MAIRTIMASYQMALLYHGGIITVPTVQGTDIWGCKREKKRRLEMKKKEKEEEQMRHKKHSEQLISIYLF